MNGREDEAKEKVHPATEKSEIVSILSAEGWWDEVDLLVPLPLAHLDGAVVHV